MFNRITVPLDGSGLAERALPYAVRLGGRLGAELHLLRTVELPLLTADRPAHREEFLKNAKFYLEGVRKTITNPACSPYLPYQRVHFLAKYGKPVTEITQATAPDLIIMTTHGRTGLLRLMLGSIATEVIRHSQVPVLLLRPPNVADTRPLPEIMNDHTSLDKDDCDERIVVTLDGTPQAEAALEPAITLAAALNGVVILLSIIPPYVPVGTVGFKYGHDVETVTANQTNEAEEYLEKIQSRVEEKGVRCYKVVRQGNVADEILNYSYRLDASLLVMATRAPGQVGQVILGSVADEVMRRSSLPVIMVPIHAPHKLDKRLEEVLTI